MYHRSTLTMIIKKQVLTLFSLQVDMIHFNANETQYQVLLEKINFWAFSVLLKFIPCILLTLMSILLIRILCDAQKRKERLLARANENSVPVSNSATSAHLLRPSNASNNDFRSGGGGRGSSGQPSLTNDLAGETAVTTTKKSSQVYLEMTPQSGMGNSYDSRIYAVDGLGSSRHASFDSKLCQHLADKVSSVCCCCCCGIGFCFCINCSRAGQGKQGEQRIKVKVSQPPSNNNNNNNIGGSSVTLFRPSSSQHHLHHHHHHHHLSVASSERTTKMLIVVLIVFLICEIPAGILAFLSGILGKMFFANVIYPRLFTPYTAKKY